MFLIVHQPKDQGKGVTDTSHKCFDLVVGFIIMLQVEGIFETQQSIGLEWRDPRLQVEEELQTKRF